MEFYERVLFVAFNQRVFALDRRDGTILWRWKVPKGGSFVTLLPDGDQVVVCSDGYLWALRATDGMELWAQPFKGEGAGIPVLVSPRSGPGLEATAAVLSAMAAERARNQQSAAATSSASH